jgi:hypothetical protein
MSSLKTRGLWDWRSYRCGCWNSVDSKDKWTFPLKRFLRDFWLDNLRNIGWRRDFDLFYLWYCFRFWWNYHLPLHSACKSNPYIIPVTAFQFPKSHVASGFLVVVMLVWI